jgi:hypothetical protein
MVFFAPDDPAANLLPPDTHMLERRSRQRTRRI